MERSNLLNDIWPYLPAFRAVAEAEHLPTAARALHVVPSALSRSVRLLEEAVGERLFNRRARRLFLNSRGQLLLEAVRQGMHAVERRLRRTPEETLEGEIRIGTIGVLTNHVVLPVLLDLARSHPKAIPAMKNFRTHEANHHLVLGSLDLAFYYDALPHAGVSCAKLGALTASVYCGRGHPLFDVPRVTRRRLLEHAFSVPSIGDRNVSMDGWPVHIDRRVGFRIELLLTNLDVCLSGQFLTVLPDIAAAPHRRAGRLRRFSLDLVPDIDVYGACREGEQDVPVHRAIFESIARRVASAGRRR